MLIPSDSPYNDCFRRRKEAKLEKTENISEEKYPINK
jgi:hypothetical protein